MKANVIFFKGDREVIQENFVRFRACNNLQVVVSVLPEKSQLSETMEAQP